MTLNEIKNYANDNNCVIAEIGGVYLLYDKQEPNSQTIYYTISQNNVDFQLKKIPKEKNIIFTCKKGCKNPIIANPKDVITLIHSL